jgi:hypothetical protein
MDETLNAIQQLLAEVAEDLKAGTRSGRSAAVAKLRRVATLASTLAFTVERRT